MRKNKDLAGNNKNGTLLPAMERHASSPLIERDSELETLASLARRLKTGEGSIVLVTGEAGLGKTSIIEAFRRRFTPDFTFLVGGNDPLTTPRPLGPICDMAASFSSQLKRLLQTSAPRMHLFDALYTELSESSPPPILIIEDIHWADSETLDFLNYIGRRICGLRCMIVLTYRDTEIDGMRAVQGVLGELPQLRVHRLPLSPLSLDGVEQLAAGVTSNTHELYRITTGNPFYVTELLATGDMSFASLPASIKDRMGARLARLPVSEREFLETLSVSPVPVSMNFVRHTFGQEGFDLATDACAHQLLLRNDNGAFAFHHELARLAILANVPDHHRQHGHERFFQFLSLENNPALIDLQVHHADKARMADDVLHVAPLAASRAAGLGAHSEAYAYFSIALKYIDEAPAEISSTIWESWAGSACVSTSMGDDIVAGRRQAARLWHQLGRPDKAAENLRWQSRLHWFRCEPQEAESVAIEAVTLLEGTNNTANKALAASLRAQLLMLTLDMAEAVNWGETALDLAARCGSIEAKVHALNTVGMAKSFMNEPDGPGLIEQSLHLATNAAYAEYAAHDADIARAYLNMADHAVEFRKFDRADAIIKEGVKKCGEIDFRSWVWQLHARKSLMLLEQGKFEDAEAIATSVLNASMLTPQMELTPRLVVARARARSGVSEAMEELEACLQRGIRAADPAHIISSRLALLECAWTNDDDRSAHHQLTLLNEINPSKFHAWNAASLSRWNIALTGGSRHLADNWPPAFDAELGGDMARACDLFMGSQLPHDAAIGLMCHAQTAPRELLPKAANILNEIGAKAALAKCYRLAGQFGVKEHMPAKKRGPYKAARCHPLNLTKRELEVLWLLSDGYSNKDISATINRSPRTVDQHRGTDPNELGVSNRNQAILRVKDEPWIMEKTSDVDAVS